MNSPTAPTIRRLLMLAAWAVLAFSRAPAVAQPTDPIAAEAQLSQSRVYLGDETLLQITVRGASGADRPRIETPAGLTIDYLNEREQSGSFTSIVNGRVTTRSEQAYIFQYRVRALAAGEVTIPPIRVGVDGRTLTTDPLLLVVIEPTEASDDVLEVSVDRAAVWVGEVVRARVRWIIAADVGEPSFETSVIDPSLTVLPSTAMPGAGREIYRFSIAGREVVGVVEDIEVDGRPARALAFDLLIKPSVAGPVRLGPISVVYDRRLAGRRMRTVCRSEPVELLVRALPTAGRPAGFTGLVGRYDIQASASQTRVNVGDPITLVVRILGTEPMSDVLTGPDLAASPGFTEDFRLSSDGWRPQPFGLLGVRGFETTLRALSADIEAIPSIRLPFFDPEAGEYRLAASEPIPIEVRSVREVTSADAIGTPNAIAPIAAAPRRTGPAVWAESHDAAALEAPPRSRADETVRSPVWIALVTAPPAAWLATVLAGVVKRRRTPEHTRSLRALRTARRALRRGDAATAARWAVSGLDGVEPDAVTAADARRLTLAGPHRVALADALDTTERPGESEQQRTHPGDALHAAVRAARAVISGSRAPRTFAEEASR